MNNPPEQPPAGDTLEQQAAAWVLRYDRGLTATEQDELSAWLAADARHGAEFARHRRHWRRLDALAEWRPEHAASPNPDLLAPPLSVRVRRWVPAALVLAAAAAVIMGFVAFRAGGPPGATDLAAKALPSGPRVLPDGSKVELNRGAEFSAEFTATERRVRLERGEAHFFVEKDPGRPFIVNAGGIDVRAVGTAFNVRIDQAAVEVLVTEGSVRVDHAAASGGTQVQTTAAPPLVPVLEARQRAVLALPQAAAPAQPPAAPQIATLTPREIERVLAWQHRLLDFNATPLSEIVAEFNRRNATQIFVVDPELASIPITASLRSDNIDGFVRLIEMGFGARVEKRGDNEILLRKVK